MIILVVNAGSSSLKYQLIDMSDESVIAKGNCDRIGIDGHINHKTADGRVLDEDCSFPTHTEAFMKLVDCLTKGDAKVIDSMDQISAVGHRIVQGADVFDKSVLVTDEIIDKIDELRELAPVHNHAHALALRACKSVIPANVPQVVVFDTAFHQTMPPKAYMFGLPYEDYEKLHVRKYGFHGTSHRFVSKALADAMGRDVKDLKIVSCHLGNGSSITAVDGGKSVDTSMGFTPLDGVVMGTRTGSVDPSAVTFVADKHGFTPSQMSEYMNKKSGFLGVSGVGSDNRDIQEAANNGNQKAQLVSDMLAYEIQKYIGAYTAAMNGLDAVLFTGGIGENSWEVREQVCQNMDYFGIKIDEALNRTIRGKLTKISTPDSKIEVWIVPTNEELLIARDTLALISK
ncbi:acetate kinase [Ruminococcus sp.]|uniref:acetate/propionate family kinase n=1 Tax=Ruminococcus sp. TaxID=41978 RepID=UPI001B45CBCC|nr:acetate kinase [Ruminococcus sp.]MBP5433384.1 acetate kinase [Ruminococcus sp.]